MTEIIKADTSINNGIVRNPCRIPCTMYTISNNIEADLFNSSYALRLLIYLLRTGNDEIYSPNRSVLFYIFSNTTTISGERKMKKANDKNLLQFVV